MINHAENNLAQTRAFLTTLYSSGHDTVFYEPCRPTERRWFTPFPDCDDFEEVLQHIKKLNEAGVHAYFGVNCRQDGGTGNEKSTYAVCYYADFDGTKPKDALKKIRSVGLPAPSILVSSGGGTHAYWILFEPEHDLAVWSDRQKWIAYALGSSVADHIPKGDPKTKEGQYWKAERKRVLALNSAADDAVTDPNRLSRLPGFYNCKEDYGPNPPLCELVECHADRKFSWKDIQPRCQKPPELIPPVPPEKKERRPGVLSAAEDFNDRGDWFRDVLGDDFKIFGKESKGWQGWRHPSASGWHKTLSLSVPSPLYEPSVHVFSPSWGVLPANTTRSKFNAYAAIKFDGDTKKASLALSEQGYGKKGHSDESATTIQEKALFASLVALLKMGRPVKDLVKDAQPHILSNYITRNLLQAIQESEDGATLAAIILRSGADSGAFVEKMAALISDDTAEAHAQTVLDSIEALTDEYKRTEQKKALETVLGRIDQDEPVSGAELREAAETADNIGGGTEKISMIDAAEMLLNPTQSAIRTGMAEFDREGSIGGLPIGLTVLAAPPGAGKSAYALQLTISSILNNEDVTALWFLGEMRSQDIIMRAVAAYPHICKGYQQDAYAKAVGDTVTVSDLYNKNVNTLSKAARKNIAYVSNELDGRLDIIDGDQFTIEGIEAAVARYRPSICVIDYLQVIRTRPGENKVDQLDDIANRIVRIGNQYECAVIGISALVKNADAKTGAGSIGRGTAIFDYAAQLVFMADVGEQQNAEKPVQWICKKNRNGMADTLDYIFNGQQQSYRANLLNVDKDLEAFNTPSQGGSGE